MKCSYLIDMTVYTRDVNVDNLIVNVAYKSLAAVFSCLK